MDSEHRGHLAALAVAGWSHQKTIDWSAIAALEGDLLDRCELYPHEPPIVLPGKWPEITAVQGKDFSGCTLGAGQDSDFAIRRHAVITDEPSSLGDRLHRAPLRRHPGQLRYPVVLQQKEDARPIRGPLGREHI